MIVIFDKFPISKVNILYFYNIKAQLTQFQ